ncbi:ATP-binding protein, partial [Candidatus Woesearchaeota archaeon]|nr:ATP-binding protein [Candidatus Woesearchaeota archaeon]
TAQWSGMLRKLEDKKILAYYDEFGMKPKDARAFNGNVRSISDPYELIDLKKHLKPGEIQIFALNKLDPKDIDIFVANSVREVFHQNFPEARQLKYMLVYDEVHRLLPKFGGSGEGFLQIERACREFRKWGIGVMLISQVLADFVGQIKANINTEVQMKTRDEGDLERIRTKYGAEFIQSLVKSPVGSGMVQNSQWNRGNPYFVTFRPIMHNVKRLSDEELDQYNKYNQIIDDIDFQLQQLEKLGQDVFDMKLELKLALDKVKSGNFNLVEIYVEGIKSRVEKLWGKLGKKPEPFQRKRVSEDEVRADIEKAKSERAQVEQKEAQTKVAEQGKKEKKGLGFDDDVEPSQILKLNNGMLVTSLSSLYDEIAAMDEETFQSHMKNGKNQFAEWISTAVKHPEI